jgi:hypothetical protein
MKLKSTPNEFSSNTLVSNFWKQSLTEEVLPGFEKRNPLLYLPKVQFKPSDRIVNAVLAYSKMK